MNKTNLSSSTECKYERCACSSNKLYCSTHRLHAEDCQPDTTTKEWICQSCGEKVIGKQKDLITQGYKHKCIDATTQGDDSKLCGCEADEWGIEHTPDAHYPESGATNTTRGVGDDSMKEQIHNICFALRMNSIGTQDIKLDRLEEINEHLSHYENKLLTLFQSQNSKTLERVREKVEELKTSQTVGTKIDLLRKVDVLAILEAEKGQK